MPEIASIDTLGFVVIFLVPGLVALYARSQFLTGRQPELKEALPTYAALTLVYYGIVFPFASYVVSLEGANWWRVAMWLLLVLLGPMVLGSLLGIMARTAFIRGVLSRVGLTSIHPMPTAWDFKFGKSDEQYVLVTLKDGTKFAGVYGQNSFASSVPDERDIYVERIFNISKNNKWESRGDNGVWLTGGEIKSIEFWPYRTKESQIEQQ